MGIVRIDRMEKWTQISVILNCVWGLTEPGGFESWVRRLGGRAPDRAGSDLDIAALLPWQSGQSLLLLVICYPLPLHRPSSFITNVLQGRCQLYPVTRSPPPHRVVYSLLKLEPIWTYCDFGFFTQNNGVITNIIIFL